jgi:hypothetical protein
LKFDDSEVAALLAEPAHILALMPGARRENDGWRARCPVHEEKTPSCRVSVRAGKARWHCFGCGARGDVLDLLKALEGLSFAQALLRLGARVDDTKERSDAERMKRVFVPRHMWEQVAEPTLFHCDCSWFYMAPEVVPPRWHLRRVYMADQCERCKKERRRSLSG